MNVVTVEDLVQELKLEVITPNASLNRQITEQMLSRPGMELTGVVEYFRDNAKRRIQIIGTKEWLYLQSLESDVRRERTRVLFTDETPVIIFSKNFEIPQEMIELSEQTGLPLLRSEKETTVLFTAISNYLEDALSPIESVHGVLVDVNGIGVLIKGKSSIGKSETALELIHRGHQLIADDRVDIYEKEPGLIVGRAPELLRQFIEVRGIGIINVVEMFGARAYRHKKRITLMIELEDWNNEKIYNRIGLSDETTRIFNTEITKITIPVRPGRSIASLIEVAAMNHRLKVMGYNAAEAFTNQLNNYIKSKNDN
ncbi:MAG: HPr(Ser) kinase/phosphatase [Turicibacter sp.]|nr:HPr(Ser) kinase/phosphatase [Turicibacter sp.]MEE0881757.1 HPr(Ser) kinase/phosphatase [Turicibacter sp.]MEE1237560.1 HPr(Ser) kinase/phosphatase [Turicibacter sp.]